MPYRGCTGCLQDCIFVFHFQTAHYGMAGVIFLVYPIWGTLGIFRICKLMFFTKLGDFFGHVFEYFSQSLSLCLSLSFCLSLSDHFSDDMNVSSFVIAPWARDSADNVKLCQKPVILENSGTLRNPVREG